MRADRPPAPARRAARPSPRSGRWACRWCGRTRWSTRRAARRGRCRCRPGRWPPRSGCRRRRARRTTSMPSAAAPWASRVAWPRRLVSATVDVVVGGRAPSGSRPAPVRVTDDADGLTISRHPHASLRPRLLVGGLRRSWARLRASRRDTCIWLMPSRLGDLGLGHALEEAQVQHDLLALGQAGDQRAEGGAVLGVGRARRRRSPSWPSRPGLVVVVAAAGVERRRAVGLAGFDGLEHLVLGDAGRGRRSRRWSASGPARGTRSSTTRVEPEVQLLHPAGHPHRPALVAEVALELADDGRGGEGRELEAPLGVEAVDRLDAGRATPPARGRRAARPGW